MNSITSGTSPARGLPALYNHVADKLSKWIPHDLIALTARVGIGAVFWLSGRTKVEGWLTVSDNAVALFADEYRLPLLPPDIAAHLAAYAEHLFPVLLVLGLASRASALALLAMTAVIEVFVYPAAWPTHLTWATALLYVAARGAGRWSLDRAIGLR